MEIAQFCVGDGVAKHAYALLISIEYDRKLVTFKYVIWFFVFCFLNSLYIDGSPFKFSAVYFLRKPSLTTPKPLWENKIVQFWTGMKVKCCHFMTFHTIKVYILKKMQFLSFQFHNYCSDFLDKRTTFFNIICLSISQSYVSIPQCIITKIGYESLLFYVYRWWLWVEVFYFPFLGTWMETKQLP